MADRLAGAHRHEQARSTIPPLTVPMPGSDTIYLTVVDKDRLAVSFINSIYCELRLGHRHAQDRHRAAEPRRRFRDRRPAIPIASAPASGRSTRSFRRWCAGMAGSTCPLASWAAPTSRWAMWRWCSTAMSMAWTRRTALDFPAAVPAGGRGRGRGGRSTTQCSPGLHSSGHTLVRRARAAGRRAGHRHRPQTRRAGRRLRLPQGWLARSVIRSVYAHFAIVYNPG